LTPPNLVEIGRATGVLFVFVVLVGEVASLSAVILSIYALGHFRFRRLANRSFANTAERR